MAPTLTRPELDVKSLDPYTFLAVLGKRVIHPGGRRSTEELFNLAQLRPGQKALDVGCGVGTTAIQMARRFGVAVTALDISPIMLDRARRNVRPDRQPRRRLVLITLRRCATHLATWVAGV